MSLYTGRDIHIDDWLELSIDNDVVKRVEELAKIEKLTTLYQHPMFEWAPGIPILDNMTGNEDE